MKKLLALFLCVLIVLTITGCGSRLSGDYVSTISGYKVSTLTFKAGGKVSHLYVWSDEPKTGIYTLDDNIIKITYDDGSKDEFKYDPKTDTFELEGLTTFTKVK